MLPTTGVPCLGSPRIASAGRVHIKEQISLRIHIDGQRNRPARVPRKSVDTSFISS